MSDEVASAATDGEHHVAKDGRGIYTVAMGTHRYQACWHAAVLQDISFAPTRMHEGCSCPALKPGVLDGVNKLMTFSVQPSGPLLPHLQKQS